MVPTISAVKSIMPEEYVFTARNFLYIMHTNMMIKIYLYQISQYAM